MVCFPLTIGRQGHWLGDTGKGQTQPHIPGQASRLSLSFSATRKAIYLDLALRMDQAICVKHSSKFLKDEENIRHGWVFGRKHSVSFVTSCRGKPDYCLCHMHNGLPGACAGKNRIKRDVQKSRENVPCDDSVCKVPLR